MSVLVYLFCKNEDKVVGNIKVDRPQIDSQTILRNSSKVKRSMFPDPTSVKDGSQMVCRRCSGPLYFKSKEIEMTPAVPGFVEVEI
jgi:hypothetical protein